MMINDYHSLATVASDSTIFEVYGMDFEDKTLKIYSAHRITLAAPNIRIRTKHTSVRCPTTQRLLTTDFRYPFSHVPLSLLSWIRTSDITQGKTVAGSASCYKARSSLYTSNPTLSKLLLWDEVLDIIPQEGNEVYTVSVPDNTSFILNNLLLQAYGN